MRGQTWRTVGGLACVVAALTACGSSDQPNTAGSGATSGSGGSSGSGGVGGTAGSGGSGGVGGTAGSSGTAGSGGTQPFAACALTTERVRITDVNVSTAIDSNESEAELRPIVIAARPSGGSRVAFMGEDGDAHIVTLDESDQLTGTPVTLAVHDFSDLYADDSGGVLLGTRDAHGSGDQHCGTLTNLCGNASSLPAQFACWDMMLVRFDGSSETWATQLTASSTEHPPYLNGPTDDDDVIYIWQAYAHHGRIAFDGSRYASYFGAAISLSQTCVQPDTSQATGVNIHQGDRMQLVDQSGALLSGMGSFDWGCSHSGYEMVVWDDTAQRFVTVCKTDNNNRIAVAPHYGTVRPIDLAAANVSDVVTDGSGGFWIATSDGESGETDVILLHFWINEDSVTLDDEIAIAATPGLNERAPHLSTYGSDGLLVAWESGAGNNDLSRNDSTRQWHMQVRSRADGAAIGNSHSVSGFRGNRYHALRGFPDGTSAFVVNGSDDTTIKVLRVLPCTP
jgi:hypothetical protein